ncbi:hypothetical protein JW930_02080 [Candidatus Woesearchaeota archaeon]|nr:hypothetical protein [Candidatus Woesearchaeota archaeon]
MKKHIFLLLITVLLVTTSCEEIMQEIMEDVKIKQNALLKGKIYLCPKDKPFRIGGFGGVCVGSEIMTEYSEKVRNDEDTDNFIRTQKALQLGDKKDCPQDRPYYVKRNLFSGDCLSAEDFKPEEVEVKGCKYDSECPKFCEGNTLWEQACNPNTGECYKLKGQDCTKLSITVKGRTFNKICVDSACVIDEEDTYGQFLTYCRVRNAVPMGDLTEFPAEPKFSDICVCNMAFCMNEAGDGCIDEPVVDCGKHAFSKPNFDPCDLITNPYILFREKCYCATGYQYTVDGTGCYKIP